MKLNTKSRSDWRPVVSGIALAAVFFQPLAALAQDQSAGTVVASPVTSQVGKETAKEAATIVAADLLQISESIDELNSSTEACYTAAAQAGLVPAQDSAFQSTPQLANITCASSYLAGKIRILSESQNVILKDAEMVKAISKQLGDIVAAAKQELAQHEKTIQDTAAAKVLLIKGLPERLTTATDLSETELDQLATFVRTSTLLDVAARDSEQSKADLEVTVAQVETGEKVLGSWSAQAVRRAKDLAIPIAEAQAQLRRADRNANQVAMLDASGGDLPNLLGSFGGVISAMAQFANEQPSREQVALDTSPAVLPLFPAGVSDVEAMQATARAFMQEVNGAEGEISSGQPNAADQGAGQ
jgi:hypothetical protein